ncbi:hypothetical protein JCM14469_26660 [Desulfatiferula olefinivorans]
MNIETASPFPKLDVPMKPGAFVLFWWGWSEYLGALTGTRHTGQGGGMAVGWIMGKMRDGK